MEHNLSCDAEASILGSICHRMSAQFYLLGHNGVYLEVEGKHAARRRTALLLPICCPTAAARLSALFSLSQRLESTESSVSSISRRLGDRLRSHLRRLSHVGTAHPLERMELGASDGFGGILGGHEH